MSKKDGETPPIVPLWSANPERRLYRAAEIGRLGYWDADFNNNVFYSSSEYLKMHGFASETIITRQEQINALIIPEERERIVAFFEDVDKRQVDYFVEYSIHRADTGELAHIEEIGEVVLSEDGTPLGHTGITRDRTQERVIQAKLKDALGRAESDVRSRDTFLANMSHELRSPLNAICGYSELLAMQPGQIGEQARTIHTAAVHLTEIIGDILIQAEAGSDTLNLNVQSVDIKDFLKEAALIAGLPDEELGPKGRIKVEPDFAVAKFDKRLITQALINILSNARKYGGEHVSIAVDFKQDETHWRFRIWDDGAGISSADIDRIMEPFYRGANARTGAVQGTGLGLSLTQRILQAHGGRMSVRSDVGTGTRVDLVIPIRA